MLLSVPFLYHTNLPNGLLYGSFSYSSCESSLLMRLAIAIISLSWILFLFMGIKPFLNKRIVFITGIGANTWPVFLLHGFFVKAIPVYWPGLLNSPWRVVLCSCAILMLTGNKALKKVIYCICFSWLEKFSAEKN